jgi:hypothetical protein
MRYMTNIKFILATLALVLMCSCDNETAETVADNNFTLECSAPQWRTGSNGQADTLVFGWERARAEVNIIHEVTSNAWKVRCPLDDTWADYESVEDILVVEVNANIGVAERSTSLEVVMGENSKKIVVIQGFYPRNGSVLPDTEWDVEDESWVGITE